MPVTVKLNGVAGTARLRNSNSRGALRYRLAEFSLGTLSHSIK